jgi:serine protease AprX
MSGTSMATPLVAGCTAVLRQALIKHGTHHPSAALIKALLINGADILSNPTPNVHSGFGHVNLANSIAVACGKGGSFYEGRFGQFNEKAFPVRIAETESTLKATLVWSDPPSHRIRNSLLLEVQHANGEERRGYDPDDYDNLNNVQQILWQNVPHGNINVTIKSHDIQILPQPFAVIWRLY